MQLTSPQNLTHRRQNLFLVSAVFTLVLFVLFLFWMLVPFNGAPGFSLSVFLLVLTALPVAIALMRGKFDLFEPINILSFIFALYFSARAIYVISEISPSTAQVSYYPYSDTIPLALWYVILGFLSLLVGYYSRIPSKLAMAFPHLIPRWSQPFSFKRILLIYAIGLCAQFVSFRLAGSYIWTTGSQVDSPMPYYLAALTQFIQYATCMTVISVFQKGASKNFVWFFWLVLVPTTIAQSLILGGRTPILAIVAQVLIAYHYLRRKISIVIVALLGIIVLTTIFPLLAIFRGNYLGSVGIAHNPAELVERIKGFPAYLSQMDRFEYLSIAADVLMQRSHGIDSLSLLIKYTPGLSDFKYGRDYLLIPAYAFVPRAIWPDKPQNFSVEFGRLYFSDPASSGSVSIGQFHIGDLYWNFGLPGIIVGMFFLGIFYRSAYLYLLPAKNKNPLRIFLYTFYLLLVVQAFEVDITSMVSNLFKTLVFLIPVLWFMKGRR